MPEGMHRSKADGPSGWGGRAGLSPCLWGVSRQSHNDMCQACRRLECDGDDPPVAGPATTWAPCAARQGGAARAAPAAQPASYGRWHMRSHHARWSSGAARRKKRRPKRSSRPRLSGVPVTAQRCTASRRAAISAALAVLLSTICACAHAGGPPCWGAVAGHVRLGQHERGSTICACAPAARPPCWWKRGAAAARHERSARARPHAQLRCDQSQHELTPAAQRARRLQRRPPLTCMRARHQTRPRQISTSPGVTQQWDPAREYCARAHLVEAHAPPAQARQRRRQRLVALAPPQRARLAAVRAAVRVSPQRVVRRQHLRAGPGYPYPYPYNPLSLYL